MIGVAVLLGVAVVVCLVVLALAGFDGALGVLLVGAFLIVMFAFGAATRRQ